MRNFPVAGNPGRPPKASDGHTLSDDFMLRRMPQWLTNASAEHIEELRTAIARHKASQDNLREAISAVEPLQAFALHQYSQALAGSLPAGQALDALVWRDRTLSVHGSTSPYSEFAYAEPVPGLMRLMQNFGQRATPLEGSGLFAAGSETLLSGPIDDLVAICRQLDAGGRYQKLLDDHFVQNKALMAQDKREGFRLAVHVAFLKGHIDSHVKAALEALAASAPTPQPAYSSAYPGLLNVLGCKVHEGLFIQLRGQDDVEQGIVIYRPAESAAPLCWYRSSRELEKALVAELQAPESRDAFLQSIGLSERHVFADKLALRLKDPQPDLQVEGEAGHGPVFERWVQAQVERTKEDARRLLVPTAEADAQASRNRLETWKSFGWGLLNLSGFFMPAVGVLLLVQLMKELCSQVFEGVQDWAAGHDHEAVEHMLNVARSAAVAGLTIGTGIAAERFIRSAFVDGMDAVGLEDGSARLWHEDLSVYESSAQGAVLDERGLYARDGQYWIAVDDHFYQVHQPHPDGPWRLCHPHRQTAYGPIVEYNGERFWRLRNESPLAWNDAAQMLDRLWPQQPRLDPQRAQWVLQAAGSDVDEVRGILVENRVLPANLRDTLRRFEADARIEAFFAALNSGTGQQQDEQLFQWCRQRPGIAELDAAQAAGEMLQRAPQLRHQLFTHLTPVAVAEDTVAKVIMRDFAAIPADYALDLASTVSAEQRRHIELLEQLPLPVASKARGLSQLARLNRARQGVMLRNAYSDESGELVMSMLSRLHHWSFDRRLELRAGSSSGRLLAVLNPQGDPATTIILARQNGQFGLHDYRGLALDIDFAEADDVFQAINACLTPTQRARLELGIQDPAGVLRQRVASTLPSGRKDLLVVLGWREQGGWFNPGQRLPDGRVGYLLGGSFSKDEELMDRIRWRLTALYRGDSRARIDEHLERIMRSEDPFEALIFEEENYQQLDSRLNAWVVRATDAEGIARHQVAIRLRRAWRRQLSADAQHQALNGRILDLSAIPVTSLPELAEAIDFQFVTTLVMVNTHVVEIPDSFFSCFTAVRRLNLSLNRLRALPSGLRHLRNLQSLQLRHNRIRMPSGVEAALSGLQQLTDLDVSFNALHSLDLRAAQMTGLRRLSVRHCRLMAWPTGLEDCQFLEMADLDFNHLTSVPDSILNMPYLSRAGLRVEGNALSLQQRERLYAAPEHVHGVLPGAGIAPRSARAIWVSGPQSEEVGARWDRLFAAGERKKLQSILGRLQETRDYQQHRTELTLQVRGLLQDLDEHPDLAEAIMAIANDETTCADSVIERFSDMRIQAMTFKAMRSGHDEQGSLLRLGLGLFRLSKLEEFIRMDLQVRETIRQAVDPIEVRLYYTVNLAREMNLPGQPLSMVFESMAQVDGSQLDEARAFVRAAEVPERQATFLGYQAFWAEWIEKQNLQAFQALDERFAEQGDRLSEQESTLAADAYQAQWDELEHARLSERFQLTVLLTRQVLEDSALGAQASVPADGAKGD